MMYAPGPLLRSVLELSARAAWILDGAGAEQRCRRAWLAWLVSAGEDAKTAALDPTASVLYGAGRRLEELTEVTLPELFGVPPDCSRPRPDHWTLLGERWPSATDVIDTFVSKHLGGENGRIAYRIASMLSHPTTSGAFVFASFAEDGVIELDWDPVLIDRTTRSALTAWAVVTQGLFEYVGWESPQFEVWWNELGSLTPYADP